MLAYISSNKISMPFLLLFLNREYTSLAIAGALSVIISNYYGIIGFSKNKGTK